MAFPTKKINGNLLLGSTERRLVPEGLNNTSNARACAGCGGRIVDRFLLHALDRYWHTHCLKCTSCSAQLGELGPACYTRAGMILCRNDYFRLFGNSEPCTSCGQTIQATELVMRVSGSRVYHLKCFACTSCRSRLVPGDRFTLVNGRIVCEQDHAKIMKSSSNRKVC